MEKFSRFGAFKMGNPPTLVGYYGVGLLRPIPYGAFFLVEMFPRFKPIRVEKKLYLESTAMPHSMTVKSNTEFVRRKNIIIYYTITGHGTFLKEDRPLFPWNVFS
jgi:hypothetical protein